MDGVTLMDSVAGKAVCACESSNSVSLSCATCEWLFWSRKKCCEKALLRGLMLEGPVLSSCVWCTSVWNVGVWHSSFLVSGL